MFGVSWLLDIFPGVGIAPATGPVAGELGPSSQLGKIRKMTPPKPSLRMGLGELSGLTLLVQAGMQEDRVSKQGCYIVRAWLAPDLVPRC